MSRLARVTLAALFVWMGAPAQASPPPVSATFDGSHHFVVVTFANKPLRPLPAAGSTGRRYAGSYGLGQSATGNASRVAATYSLRQVASWPIKTLGVHCVVYQVPDSLDMAEVLARLSRDPSVTLAQPLQEFHTSTTQDTAAAVHTYNDPLYGLQTNLGPLGIPAAHARSQGAGVKVALIDTGVDTSHPDLRGRVSATHSYIASSLRAVAGPGAFRHGTAMAGLIAAAANNGIGIVGVAPLSRIEVFEACWQLKPNADEAVCNTFTLAQALAAAIDTHMRLINMSIAGPPDPLLTALVRSGLKQGLIFVGSSGGATGSFPTDIDGVIGVTTPEASAHPAFLSAPADHVLTLRPGAQYDFESGSSVAAAEVTGAVALLLSSNSRLQGADLFALLKGSRAAGNAGGAGIDIEAALVRSAADKLGNRLARSVH